MIDALRKEVAEGLAVAARERQEMRDALAEHTANEMAEMAAITGRLTAIDGRIVDIQAAVAANAAVAEEIASWQTQETAAREARQAKQDARDEVLAELAAAEELRQQQHEARLARWTGRLKWLAAMAMLAVALLALLGVTGGLPEALRRAADVVGLEATATDLGASAPR